MSLPDHASGAFSADTLIHPRWLVPMTEKGLVLTRHSLAIRDAEIVAVGPTESLKNACQASVEISLDNHVLIPGLINAHGHSPMTLFRGFADDMPLQTWLEEKIWPAESKWVSEEFVRDGAALAIAEMLRSGTTAFTDMYFFPEEVAKVALQANIRVQLASPILDSPTVYARDAEEYIHKTTDLNDRYKNSEHIQVAFGPHAPYTVSDGPLQKISTLANELEIPIHIHLHENAREIAEAISNTGRRPLARLEQLGLLSQLLQCVHATQLKDDEISLLADAGVTIVHCPASNANLASGLCRTQDILDAGINLALGTDGAASNNELNMINEMRMAALFGKACRNDAAATSAWDVLAMATVNGAQALGRSDRLGMLAPGRLADCVAVDLGTLNCQPVFDPVSTLVYSAQGNQVSHVWVNGKMSLEQGRLVHMDENELLARAQDWADKIR